MDIVANLHWVDYVVLIFVLSFTITIGVFFALKGDRQRSTEEYFTGNRNLGFLSTVMSISVSFFSGMAMIGIPSEVYLYGGQYILHSFSQIIGVGFAAVFIVPIMYPLKLVSVNRYLEIRFNTPVFKLIGTGLNLVFAVFYIAVCTYTPAVVISLFTGWAMWTIIIVSSLVAIFFTTIGGIKAVIWSDVFLFICMFSAVGFIIFQATNQVGGIEVMRKVIQKGERSNVFDFRIDPTIRQSFWAIIVGTPIQRFCNYGFYQSSVQRYTNLDSLWKAQCAICLASFANALLGALLVVAGLTIYGYYAHFGCDPIRSGLINGPNQLVAYFVMDTLNFPGIQGAFIASILAGSLTSVSSVLNSVAANTWDDFLRHLLPDISTHRAMIICKLLVVAYGTVSICICFLLSSAGGTLTQLSRSLVSLFLTPTVGMFMIGMFCPWINNIGLVGGTVSGFVLILFISLGQYITSVHSRTILPTITSNCSDIYLNYTNASATINGTTLIENSEAISKNVFEWLYSISYNYYPLVVLSTSVVVGSLTSVCTGLVKWKNINDNYLGVCFNGKHTNTEAESELMMQSHKNL